MISAQVSSSSIFSGLAILVALISAVLSYRAATKNSEATTKSNAANTEIARANAELARIRAVNETLSNEVDRLNDRVTELTGEHARCESSLVKAHDRISTLERKVDELEGRSR